MQTKIKALAVAAMAVGAFTFTVSHLNANSKSAPQGELPVTYADVMKLASASPDGGTLIVFLPNLPIYCEADFDCSQSAAEFGCLEIDVAKTHPLSADNYGYVCHGPTYRHQLSRHSA